MKLCFFRSIILGLVISLGLNTVSSFAGLWGKKKQSTIQKLVSDVKGTYDTLKSSKLAKQIIGSFIFATLIYIYFLISCKLAGNDFDDASPEQRKMLEDIAKELDLRNSEKINFKLSTINNTKLAAKTWKRSILDLLFLVPLIRKNFDGSIGCTCLAGNVYILPSAFNSKDKIRFVLGHELTHYKYKDTFVGFFSQTALDVLLNVLLVGTDLSTIKAISQILHSQTVGKIFEIRADLFAASLGENVANAGIDLFKDFQRESYNALLFMSEYEQRKVLIQKILFDPHPFTCLRIKYLEWYKNWKFSKKTENVKKNKLVLS